MLALEEAPARTSWPCAECGAATREQKPLCEEHVLLMPYAQGVRDRLEELERQAEAGEGPEFEREVLAAASDFDRDKLYVGWIRRAVPGSSDEGVAAVLKRHGALLSVETGRTLGYASPSEALQALRLVLEEQQEVEVAESGNGLLTAKELAELMGVSWRTVHGWRKVGMPVAGERKGRGGTAFLFDPDACRAWKEARRRRRAAAPPAPKPVRPPKPKRSPDAEEEAPTPAAGGPIQGPGPAAQRSPGGVSSSAPGVAQRDVKPGNVPSDREQATDAARQAIGQARRAFGLGLRAAARGLERWAGRLGAVLLVSLALALVACELPEPRDPVSKRGIVSWISAEVELPGQEERTETLRELDLAEALYQRCFGGYRELLELRLYNRAVLPSGSVGRCWWDDRGRAWISLALQAAGGPGRILIHELHHAAIGDGEHQDPSWSRVADVQRIWGVSWAWAQLGQQ